MIKDNYSKVFTWLFAGLLITFLTGYTISLTPITLMKFMSGGSYIAIVIAELLVAIIFSVRLQKMSKITAIICYVLYSFLTGITFGSIFLVFKLSSIMAIFLISALVFIIFALIGSKINKDLSKISMWLFMSLLAIIIATVINIFLKSSIMDLVITIISTIIFLGYIIYDMKNIDAITYSVGEEKGAIFGAFQLYLDFINLFINLLKLLGKYNDN